MPKRRKRGYKDAQEKVPQKSGKPWNIIGKFSEYEGADILRKGVLLEADETLEVKVKKLVNGYVVKSRAKDPDPTTTPKKRKNKKKGKKSEKVRSQAL